MYLNQEIARKIIINFCCSKPTYLNLVITYDALVPTLLSFDHLLTCDTIKINVLLFKL